MKYSQTGAEPDIPTSPLPCIQVPLTGGKIPTRFVIPDTEGICNEANFIAARTGQGRTNTLSSAVWWDK